MDEPLYDPQEGERALILSFCANRWNMNEDKWGVSPKLLCEAERRWLFEHNFRKKWKIFVSAVPRNFPTNCYMQGYWIHVDLPDRARLLWVDLVHFSVKKFKMGMLRELIQILKNLLNSDRPEHARFRELYTEDILNNRPFVRWTDTHVGLTLSRGVTVNLYSRAGGRDFNKVHISHNGLNSAVKMKLNSLGANAMGDFDWELTVRREVEDRARRNGLAFIGQIDRPVANEVANVQSQLMLQNGVEANPGNGPEIIPPVPDPIMNNHQEANEVNENTQQENAGELATQNEAEDENGLVQRDQHTQVEEDVVLANGPGPTGNNLLRRTRSELGSNDDDPDADLKRLRGDFDDDQLTHATREQGTLMQMDASNLLCFNGRMKIIAGDGVMRFYDAQDQFKFRMEIYETQSMMDAKNGMVVKNVQCYTVRNAEMPVSSGSEGGSNSASSGSSSTNNPPADTTNSQLSPELIESGIDPDDL